MSHDCHVISLPQDMGTMVMGKVESGSVLKGTSLTLMPNKVYRGHCIQGVTVYRGSLYIGCHCI